MCNTVLRPLLAMRAAVNVTRTLSELATTLTQKLLSRPVLKPVGPHPSAMFEVNLFTPAQFGAFIPWLVVNRGPLNALVHPNTGDDLKDHSNVSITRSRDIIDTKAILTKNNSSQLGSARK